MGQKFFKDSLGTFTLTYVVIFLMDILLPVFYNGQPFNQGVVVFALIGSLLTGTSINMTYFIVNMVRQRS